MNTAGPNKLCWIPGHLMLFLSRFAEINAISAWIQHILRNIVSFFQTFRESKTDNGLAWEYLFQIVVLIRLLGGIVGGIRQIPRILPIVAFKSVNDYLLNFKPISLQE